IAYLITKNPNLTKNELRTFLSAKLTSAMIPAHFVFLNEFPITPNGKVDKKSLPDPNFESETLSETLSPAEKVVFEIFKKALNIQHFSKYDSFFELGGHSLLVAKILT